MMAYEMSKSARDNLEKIHPPIPTWNQDTYQKTWKDINTIL